MSVTREQYEIYQDAALVKCIQLASIYGVPLADYAQQEGYSGVAEMVKWETVVIAYGGEIKPDASLVVQRLSA